MPLHINNIGLDFNNADLYDTVIFLSISVVSMFKIAYTGGRFWLGSISVEHI